MSEDQEKPVQFPQYAPQGIPIAPQNAQKPLMKMVKMLAKPLKSRDPFHSRVRIRKKMKPVRFY